MRHYRLRMLLSFPLFLFPIILIFKLLSYSFYNLGVVAVSWQDASQTSKSFSISRQLTDEVVEKIANSIDNHHREFNDTLDYITIPRVPGTANHDKVRKYLINAMKLLGWTVEEDKFRSTTPHGEKPFSNIIATLNPRGCRRLVLACHYDSLQNREGTFVGATDSAVPCAMLIHMAKLLNVELRKHSKKETNTTLQFIFFDGEEAFHRWSKTDSLYGSRHLAAKWNGMAFSQEENAHCKHVKDAVSELDRMDVLVLLDLIGSANPTFYNYFLETRSQYTRLVQIENRLNNLKLLEIPPPQPRTQYFNDNFILAYIEDDHIPFMKKGVPIVHLIPYPFPSVWHKESDNKENLHHPTINNLNKILFVFVADYLNLYAPGPIAM